METIDSKYYLSNIIKNILLFIIFWSIFFYNILKNHPEMKEWTTLLILDYLGLPTAIMVLGYIFFYLTCATGVLPAFMGTIIFILAFAYGLDAIIAKLGLPANYWPYAIGLIGLLINLINLFKLISNIRWYSIFRYNEKYDM